MLNSGRKTLNNHKVIDNRYSVIDKLSLPDKINNKLKNDIGFIMAQNIKELLYIVLFGSCARLEYNINSDIDLLLITSKDLSRIKKGEIRSELDKINGITTDVVFYNKEDFQKSDCLLVRQIKKEGIVLWRS